MMVDHTGYAAMKAEEIREGVRRLLPLLAP